MRNRILFAFGCAAALASAAAAQQVRLTGQIRPRYEFRDPATDNRSDEFVSMRLRAGFEASLANDIAIMIQFQDIRFWGEETSPLGDFRADNLDLHQGYVTIRDIGGGEVWARIGRQESPLGNERLLGIVDWAQQGQSFDGIRLATDAAWGSASALAFKIAEQTAGRPDDLWLLGGFASLEAGDGAVELFGFYERLRGSTSTDEGTVGARYAGRTGRLDGAIEGAFQFGTRADQDVSAFLMAASGGARLTDDWKLTLWWDWLSGDDDPADDEVRVFHTLYATNHKFYGLADLFTNIPAHTAGRGLHDFAVKTSWTATRRVSVDVDVHAFRLAEERTLDDARLGEELDITLRWAARRGLDLTGGFSHVFHADALSSIGRLDDDMSFAYAMLNVAF